MVRLIKNNTGTRHFWLGMVFFTTILLVADYLASSKPLVQVCQGIWSFPAFENAPATEKKPAKECTYRLYPLIRYSPYEIDTRNAGYVSPFDRQNVESIGFRHWLGTDKIGRDVAAGLVHGAKNSLWIGLCTTLLGLLLGVPYGLLLGYYQDHGVRWNPVQILVFTAGLFWFLYYIWFPPTVSGLGILFLFYLVGFCVFTGVFILSKHLSLPRYFIPVDLLGYRLLEWRKSIPALFLLLALVSVLTKPSLIYLVGLMAFLAWADIARLIRAETLQLKSNLYVQSGIAFGFSNGYLIRRYILPGLKNSIFVIAMYMMAGSILLESTLSFLGLGLPVEEVSWGKMLAESRDAKAWWMAVFPGGCLVALLFWLHRWTDKFGRN